MFSVCRNFSRTRRVFSPSYGKTAAAIWSQDQTLTPRVAPSRKTSEQRFNVPISAEFVARVSGIPTMARLPYRETADGLDAAFVGVPIDTGTSNRPGARSGFSRRCSSCSRVLSFTFAPSFMHNLRQTAEHFCF